jgi:hypothetical protein
MGRNTPVGDAELEEVRKSHGEYAHERTEQIAGRPAADETPMEIVPETFQIEGRRCIV